MKKTDVRVIRTHNQLFASLVALLKEKSFDEISVSEICENADVHRATFYKHFNDKNELLSFCVNNLLKLISFDDLKENPTPENIKKNIMNFVKTVLKFIENNKNIISTVCTDNYSITLVSSFTEAVYTFCYEKLSSVVSAPSHKLEVFSSYYSGAFVGVINWFVRENNSELTDDVMDFIEHRCDELCDYYAKNMFIAS